MKPVELLSPSDAQEQYDLTGSLLRRYALTFEQLGGNIPRDKRGGRMYTREVLEHFVEATARVQDGATVEDALRVLTADAGELVTHEPAPDGGAALEVLRQVLSTQKELLEQVKGIREEAQKSAAQSELDELRRKVEELELNQRETLLESLVKAVRRRFNM